VNNGHRRILVAADRYTTNGVLAAHGYSEGTSGEASHCCTIRHDDIAFFHASSTTELFEEKIICRTS